MNNFKALYQHVMRSWRHHLLLQMGSLVVITSALTIVFSMFLFFLNLEKALISWGSESDINIFLKENMTGQELNRAQSSIEKLGYFKKIEYVDKKQASEKFFSKMSKYVPDFANEKDFASLIPASFIGTMLAKHSINEIQNISEKVLQISGVEDVSYGQEWISNLSSFLFLIKKIGWLISLTLIVGCFFVIGFSIYAILIRRREEIEVYELCGATPAAIQIPFVFEAMLISVVSSIAALILSAFMVRIENKFFISQMKYLGFNDLFEFASIGQQMSFIFLTAIISGLVALFCVRKINTGWSQAARETLG